jgi:hypothetical protein
MYKSAIREANQGYKREDAEIYYKLQEIYEDLKTNYDTKYPNAPWPTSEELEKLQLESAAKAKKYRNEHLSK